MSEEQKGNVQAALEALEEYQVVVLEDLYASDGTIASAVALGHEMRIESLKPVLDQYLKAPDRKRGKARLNDLESLAAYVNRYKTADTLVFLDDADPHDPSVEVVFDAHGAQTADGSSRAGWGEFGARYHFPLSPEWVAWRDVAGKWLDQAAFALFLEEHILDVIDPTDPGERAKQIADSLGIQLAGQARLLELSRGLSINVNQAVTNELSLGSGEGQIVFAEKHVDKGGAQLRIPGAFAIALPVFRGQAVTAYRMIVMLRYRVKGPAVVWLLSPHLIDKVFEDALLGAAKELEQKTAIPVLRGHPRG